MESHHRHSTLRWTFVLNQGNQSRVFVVVILLFLGYLAQGVPSFEADKSDKEILDILLDPVSYDKRIRPNVNTDISVHILLHSLSSPDESSLNYEVEFLLFREWVDPRLRFDDEGRNEYLNGLLHVNNIWLPGTYIVNHGSSKEPLVDMSLRVYRNGTVLHILRRGIAINCQGNLMIFPFDNPKCPFAIESVSLEESEMKLHWAEHTLPLSGATSLQSFNAYLIKSETGSCNDMFTWRGNFSCLNVLLVFTRDKNFYLSTVFAPGIILVASAFISFWLDKGVVPARVMIGVTTMLSFATTTNNFRSSLPVVSNLTAMNLWDAVCMFFIYASLLEFVFVNYLYRKPEDGSEKAQNQLLCKKCGKSGSSQVVPEVPQLSLSTKSDSLKISKFAWIRGRSTSTGRKMTSLEMSHWIENTAKVIFPISFIIFVLCFFIAFSGILPNQPENWSLNKVGHNLPIRSRENA